MHSVLVGQQECHKRNVKSQHSKNMTHWTSTDTDLKSHNFLTVGKSSLEMSTGNSALYDYAMELQECQMYVPGCIKPPHITCALIIRLDEKLDACQFLENVQYQEPVSSSIPASSASVPSLSSLDYLSDFSSMIFGY